MLAAVAAYAACTGRGTESIYSTRSNIFFFFSVVYRIVVEAVIHYSTRILYAWDIEIAKHLTVEIKIHFLEFCSLFIDLLTFMCVQFCRQYWARTTLKG